jgi:hypothetical protein
MHSCHNQNVTQRRLDQVRARRAEVLVVAIILLRIEIKLDQADCSKPFSVSPVLTDTQIQTRIIPLATVEVEALIMI